MSFLRTILALSRPARLPTVWSNCLAGWWLGGGGNLGSLPVLLAGATLLFLGGAFLHDAFDTEFDQQHRPDRPIPTGSIPHRTVFRWGIALLSAGALLFLFVSQLTGVFALVLVLCIVLYQAVHRLLPVAPLFEGLCRLLLYLLGAAFADRGIGGWPIWCGIALGFYMAGWRFLQNSRTDAKPQAWPVALLAVPIALALIMDVDGYRETGLLLSAVLVLWVARSLRPAFFAAERRVVQAAAALVPGIVFVDWLATCPVALPGQDQAGPRELSLVFLALFGMTVLLQKLVPE